MKSLTFAAIFLALAAVSKSAPQEGLGDIIDPVSMEIGIEERDNGAGYSPMEHEIRKYEDDAFEEVQGDSEENSYGEEEVRGSEEQNENVEDEDKNDQINTKEENPQHGRHANYKTTTRTRRRWYPTKKTATPAQPKPTSSAPQAEPTTATENPVVQPESTPPTATEPSASADTDDSSSQGPPSSELAENTSANNLQAHINKVVCETNKRRKDQNLPPLEISKDLNEISQKHSVYQNKNSKTTHDDPEGSLGARLGKRGIKWTFAAENVAGGFTDPVKVVEAWMKSPGHKANILNPKNAYIGIGQDGKFWTQNFANFKKTDKTTLYQQKC